MIEPYIERREKERDGKREQREVVRNRVKKK